MTSALWNRGVAPSADTIVTYRPLVPNAGFGIHVDGVVACRIKLSNRGTNRDCLASTDFTGDDTERGLLDAVMDTRNGFGVGVSDEELSGRDVLAERCPGEPEVCDSWAGHHARSSLVLSVVVVWSSMLNSAGSTASVLPSTLIVAVRVTLRVADQRNASINRAGSG